jgi:hypothetical protein
MKKGNGWFAVLVTPAAILRSLVINIKRNLHFLAIIGSIVKLLNEYICTISIFISYWFVMNDEEQRESRSYNTPDR